MYNSRCWNIERWFRWGVGSWILSFESLNFSSPFSFPVMDVSAGRLKLGRHLASTASMLNVWEDSRWYPGPAQSNMGEWDQYLANPEGLLGWDVYIDIADVAPAIFAQMWWSWVPGLVPILAAWPRLPILQMRGAAGDFRVWSFAWVATWTLWGVGMDTLWPRYQSMKLSLKRSGLNADKACDQRHKSGFISY